jgi:hypothetical protein
MILEMNGKSDENHIDVVDNRFDLQDAVVTDRSPREIY